LLTEVEGDVMKKEEKPKGSPDNSDPEAQYEDKDES
jgi:hypothetical protein